MKTASVRDLRQDFPRILGWLDAGEEVAITMRRQAVARLIPWPKNRSKKRQMPDIEARLDRVFGEKVISDRTIRNILDSGRREF